MWRNVEGMWTESVPSTNDGRSGEPQTKAIRYVRRFRGNNPNVRTSRPNVVSNCCGWGVTAWSVIGAFICVLRITVSRCWIVSTRASRAADRLLSIGVLRFRVSYERTWGCGDEMHFTRRTKWSRAWRRCFPIVILVWDKCFWHRFEIPIVDPGKNLECIVSWSSDVR